MSKAVVTIEGDVIEFVDKAPTVTSPKWKIIEVKYPSYDAELFDCSINQLVNYDTEEIEFTLTPKDAATQMAVMKKRMTTAVQNHLDIKAQERGYDSIFTACTYANSTNLTFKNEALAFVAWRDAVWSYCYQELDKVLNQTRSMPTIDAFMLELPEVVL